MLKKLFLLMCICVFALLCANYGNQVFAQTAGRASVGASEVNGTYRYYFNGKFKGSYDEIKILALGKGKLKTSFDLVYPYATPNGDLSANMGEATGEAIINGDTAVYSSSEFPQCKITIKFVKPGTIKVAQSGSDAECGFGMNVSAGGTYRKISNAKPKF